jgi:hypothetical protein
MAKGENVSWEAYEEDCPDCRPAMVDMKTGQVMPDDAPMMRFVLEVFKGLTLAEKQAWHRFTCQNSRAPADLKVIESITQKLAGFGKENHDS